jgi:predicted ATP-dependent endonuclease of OLD family
MKKEEGIKVLSLVVENFKNIEKTEVDFAGRSATIIGKNGAGKSSLIQAICSPIDSNYIPAKPVKKGEERGSIELTIGGSLHGEEETYTLGLHFSEKHKKGRITVTNGEGEKVNGGKQFISDIVGNIGFDIQEFIKLGVTSNGSISKPGTQEQIEILKKLMPKDVLKQMHDLDKEFKDVYEARADVNRDILHAKSRLEGHDFSQDELERYNEVVDTEGIVSKMTNIEKELERYNKVFSTVDSLLDSIPLKQERLALLEEKVEALHAEITADIDKLDKGEVWLTNKTKPSIEAMNIELSNANMHNNKVKEVKSLQDSQIAIRLLQESSEANTERLDKIKREKKQIFTSSPLPVKGLTFDEEGIYFKGLPFVEGQHPSSTIISIGAKIGMALNPNLRMLVIKDGSLLDKKTLKWLVSQCEKENYQLFVEMVADNEEVEIEFIER